MNERRNLPRALADRALVVAWRTMMCAVLVGAVVGVAKLRHYLKGGDPVFAPPDVALSTAPERRPPAEFERAVARDSRVPAIAAVLRDRTGGDSLVAQRAAAMIVSEADRAKLNPALLVGVVLVENTSLKPTARNPQSGATGLMQVMPFHAGKLGCGSSVLTDVESNICHGTRILVDAMQEQGPDLRKSDLAKALLRYNGCVRGTVTPDCFRYPNLVIQRAIQAANQVRRIQRELDVGRANGVG